MIEAVRNYLALLRSPPTASDRLAALAASLDQLACACHAAPEIARDDVPEFPDRTTYEAMRDIAIAAFPDFGVYAVVVPDQNPAQQTMMGDAIDDLADIALEMARVERLWENDTRDAAWQFRFGYRNHWGRHLHDLRSFVHRRQFGS